MPARCEAVAAAQHHLGRHVFGRAGHRARGGELAEVLGDAKIGEQHVAVVAETRNPMLVDGEEAAAAAAPTVVVEAEVAPGAEAPAGKNTSRKFSKVKGGVATTGRARW